MATPQSDRLALTPKTPAATTTITSTPFTVSTSGGSRVLRAPLSDEAIWKRLKEAGFDEDSIKRRDKATLIAYIAKLEAEVFLILFYMYIFPWPCVFANSLHKVCELGYVNLLILALYEGKGI